MHAQGNVDQTTHQGEFFQQVDLVQAFRTRQIWNTRRQGWRATSLPSYAFTGPTRNDASFGQEAQARDRRGDLGKNTYNYIAPTRRRLGGPIGAKLLPRRPCTAHAGWVDASLMTGMRSPWMHPGRTDGTTGPARGRMRWGPAARLVNG